jgi:LuxR family transcriptional regulator, maltose regulon positive regulatory protein
MELRRSEPDEIRALHGAAAEWFASHGYPVEAVRHAQVAEVWSLAARLLSDQWLGLVLDGQAATAHELLAGFPPPVAAGDAELAAVAAGVELTQGSLEDAERHLALEEAELPSVPADRRARLEATVAVLRLQLARQLGDVRTRRLEAGCVSGCLARRWCTTATCSSISGPRASGRC